MKVALRGYPSWKRPILWFLRLNICTSHWWILITIRPLRKKFSQIKFFYGHIFQHDEKPTNHQKIFSKHVNFGWNFNFKTLKTRILFPRFWDNVTYKNFNFKFSVISASSYSTVYGFVWKFVSRVSQDL